MKISFVQAVAATSLPSSSNSPPRTGTSTRSTRYTRQPRFTKVHRVSQVHQAQKKQAQQQTQEQRRQKKTTRRKNKNNKNKNRNKNNSSQRHGACAHKLDTGWRIQIPDTSRTTFIQRTIPMHGAKQSMLLRQARTSRWLKASTPQSACKHSETWANTNSQLTAWANPVFRLSLFGSTSEAAIHNL